MSVEPMFPAGVVVSEALRNTLVDLEATNPERVYKKTMNASDRGIGQNRLLISCKKKKKNGEAELQALFDHILTEKEKIQVYRQDPAQAAGPEKQQGEIDGCGSKEDQGKNDGRGNKDHQGKKRDKKGKSKKDKSKKKRKRDKSEEDTGEEEKEKSKGELGLPVRAYDRDGRSYDVRWKYLESNTAYRIKGSGWGSFLRQNSLLYGGGGKRRKISPGEEFGGGGENPTSSSPDEEAAAEGEKDAADVFDIQLWTFRSRKLALGDKDGHPHGALGLVLLHDRQGEEEAADDIGQQDHEMDAHEAPTEDDDDVVASDTVVAAAAGGGKQGEAAPRLSAAREGSLTSVEWFLSQTILLFKVRDRNNRADLDAANCACQQQGPECTCSDQFTRASAEVHRPDV